MKPRAGSRGASSLAAAAACYWLQLSLTLALRIAADAVQESLMLHNPCECAPVKFDVLIEPQCQACNADIRQLSLFWPKEHCYKRHSISSAAYKHPAISESSCDIRDPCNLTAALQTVELTTCKGIACTGLAEQACDLVIVPVWHSKNHRWSPHATDAHRHQPQTPEG